MHVPGAVAKDGNNSSPEEPGWASRWLQPARDGDTGRGGGVRSHSPHEGFQDAEVWEHGVQWL